MELRHIRWLTLRTPAHRLVHLVKVHHLGIVIICTCACTKNICCNFDLRCIILLLWLCRYLLILILSDMRQILDRDQMANPIAHVSGWCKILSALILIPLILLLLPKGSRLIYKCRSESLYYISDYS